MAAEIPPLRLCCDRHRFWFQNCGPSHLILLSSLSSLLAEKYGAGNTNRVLPKVSSHHLPIFWKYFKKIWEIVEYWLLSLQYFTWIEIWPPSAILNHLPSILPHILTKQIGSSSNPTWIHSDLKRFWLNQIIALGLRGLWRRMITSPLYSIPMPKKQQTWKHKSFVKACLS